jgi:hypothetical protein
MPSVQDQYKIGPEITEIRDPTVEEEQSYRIARSPPALLMGDCFKNLQQFIVSYIL